MKVGVGLRVPYTSMPAVATAADELGYESVWLPEHLVLPVDAGRSPTGHALDPHVPTYDVLVFLAELAHVTGRIRLGTWVYNLALRHPLVSARAVQTLDILSEGRVLLGVGAGWLEGEYAAAGVDFASRGRRLEECIAVLRVLWTEDEPRFEGRFFSIPAVGFEPKPIQGAVPILVGGESGAALRRAARIGDGWIGMQHDPGSAAARVARLGALLAEEGRDRAGFEVTVGAPRGAALEDYLDTGIDRLIVMPWDDASGAVQALERFADTGTGALMREVT